MKQFARKAIPMVCVITAPFFVNADESLEATPMLCAATKATLANANGSKMTCQETGPMVSNWADPFITADFIYWKAEVDNLDYAYNGAAAVTEGTLATEEGHMYHPNFKYEPGFKVGFGLKFKHDGWDLFGQYTWLQVDKDDTRSHAHSDSDVADILQGTIVHNSNGDSEFFGSASAAWSLKFNVVDLELGRDFWVSKRLSLRPFTGMKFSWIHQDFDFDGDDVGEVDGINLDYDMHVKQSGVGLRSGLNTAFYMWNKWSIFGDLAISGMLNDFSSKREDSYQDEPADEFTQLHVHKHSHPVTGILEFALGLRFDTCFSNNRYKYMLEAGWENQVWFGQSPFLFLQSNTPGNLSFSGLTIKTGFYF
jgi:hypothetical protein